MKKNIAALTLMLVVSLAAYATELINENIQSWTSHTSYGSYAQTISAGTVNMTDCIVAPTGAASGTGSIGYVQIKASTGILAFPALTSVGSVEFRIHAGGTGRTVKLQQYTGSIWSDLTTISNIGTTGATFTYNVNASSSTTLRLATPNNAIYVHDIIISDYSSGPSLPLLSTTAISGITTTGANSGGNISSDGGASVTARGVCWNTSTNPTISNSHSSDGAGVGSFTSAITGLSAATQYFVRAYATNSQGTAYGEELSFYSSGVSPPSAPTATSASNVGVSSFTANWGSVSGATSYLLDVSLNSGFSSFVGTYHDYAASGTTQAVSGLSASTTYFYRVRASNSGGNSTYSNSITVSTQAADPFNGYYNPVTGLSGSALKAGLHTLIKNTHSHEYNYDDLEVQMKITDEDPNNSNNVIELYTGWSVPKSTYGGTTTSWNKEHTWSKSHGDFGDTAPAGSDLHHLRPCDATVNSFKSNRDFDEGTNAYTDASPPTGYPGTTGCYYNTSDDFEPRDEDKGDVARMIFYMATRYEGTDTTYDLELVDYVYSDAGTNEPLYGKLSTLLAWHVQDPPDAWEALRNNRIQNLQGNRNPFIDHPEYVASIWSGSTATTYVEFNPTTATVNETDGSVNLTLQILNPSAFNATTAQIQLSTGSAADIGNYSTRTLSFPAGSSATQSTSINITDDSLLEGAETLTFALVNVSGGTNAAIGTYGSFTLNITDNDVPTVVATAATNVGDSGFTANWQAASGISTYLFDLSTNSGFGSNVGSYHDFSVAGTSLIITGLSENSSYFYRVKASYNGSEGSYSNVITTTTTGVIYLDAPVALAATAASHEGFTARWNGVSGADGYRLDVFTGTFSNAELSTGFEGSTSFPAGWTNSSAYVQNTASNAHTGTYYAGLNLVERYFYTPLLTNPSSCSFWARNSASTANCTLKLQSSPDGLNWTDHGSFSAIAPDAGSVTSTYSQKVVNLNLTGSYYIRWYMSSRSGGSIYVDDVAISYQSGTMSFVSGWENASVSGNVVRISGLEPSSNYSYQVRAENPGDTSENSNRIDVSTTAVLGGTGANTAINGAATTVLLPVVNGFSNNDLEIDPISTSNDDYAVNCSTFAGGVSYSIGSSNNSAFNGSYILHHDGLGFTPLAARYILGGTTYQVSTLIAGLTQSELTITGLSRGAKGTLQIDLLRDGTLPVELSSFTAVINARNNVALQWVTQSESALLGYYVLRSGSASLDEAGVISPLVAATNTSQQQYYVYVDDELEQDGNYYYWLQNLEMNGEYEYHGPISVNYTTGEDAEPSPQPTTTLDNSWPNPFSASARIPYSLAKAGQVDFHVYNLKGQIVKRYPSRTKNAGVYSLEWNGSDDAGRYCSNGLYFIVMQADGKNFIRKVIIAR